MKLPESVRKRLFNANERNFNRIASLAAEYFPNKKNASILDLGSGDGGLIKQATDSMSKISANQVHCVEIFPDRADQCREKGFKTYGFDLNEDFPFKDNRFDGIVANQIIEHLYFPDLFLSEIYRVLKPGGILVLSSTNLAALHSRIMLLLGYTPNSLHPSWHPVGNLVSKKGMNPLHGHKSIFTGKGMRELTEIHGFKVLLYETQTVILTPEPLSSLICKVFDWGTHANVVARKPKRPKKVPDPETARRKKVLREIERTS